MKTHKKITFTLKNALNALTVPELKERIKLLKNKIAGRKAELVESIYGELINNHKYYWQQLSKIEQLAISEAIYQKDPELGYSFYGKDFKAKYGELPTSSQKGNMQPVFLFFYAHKVPDDLVEYLRYYVLKPPEDTVKTCSEEQLPTEIEIKSYGDIETRKLKIVSTEKQLQYDLNQVLQLISMGKISVSDKTKQATAASLKHLEQHLSDGDYYSTEEDLDIDKYEGNRLRPIRTFAWPLLVQSAGLAKLQGKKLQLTVNGKKVLSQKQSLEKTIKAAYQRWRNKGLLDEFKRIQMIKGQASKGRIMTAVAPRKKYIETALLSCPTQSWIAIDEFFRFVQASGNDFSVTHNPWKLYIADREYGNLGYSGHHDFNMLQGNYILVYFFEYLATLGIIDIAYISPYHVRREDFHGIWGTDDLLHLSRYDGLLYFRINALGAYCLGLSTSYQPPVFKQAALFSIDDDLNIDLKRKPEPLELNYLNDYTQVIPTPSSTPRYKLDSDYLLDALQEGKPFADFKQFLEDSSDSPLPNNLISLLDFVVERENALMYEGQARLFYCHNNVFAKMLSTDPSTAKYCIYIGNRRLAIPEKTEKMFIKGIRKLGYIYPKGDV